MKLVILTIPGIGSKKPGYSQPLYDDLIAHWYGTPLYDQFKIVETLPFYQTKLDENQEQIFDRLDKNHPLGGPLSLRKFVLEAFGDGVTYEHQRELPDSTYMQVHRHIQGKIAEANALIHQHPGAKLVVVAASLGSHIFSNYLYDAQKNLGIFKDKPATDEEKLEHLAHLATLGCNIPLFVSGLPKERIIAFRKPKNNTFEWFNYYDSDDVLGWPLKELSPSFEQLVTDVHVNTGMYVGSHVRYWDDNEFTKPFALKCLALTK